MVIFYAFTHLNMIQCMNTKIHYYPQEKAYLIVRVTPMVSKEIVDTIKKSNIFDDVFCIDMPLVDVKKIKWGNIKGLRTIRKMKVMYKFYEKYLSECFYGKKCDTLIISGGWNDSIFVAYYFAQNNPNLKILFVEDGNAAYVKSRKTLYEFRPDMLGKKKITKLARYLAERKYSKVGLKHLGREIYVSSPELYEKKKPDAEAIPLGLPCVDEHNSELRCVVKEMIQNNMRECEKKFYVDINNLSIIYDKRKIIFFPDYHIAESSQLALMDRIIHKVPDQYVIIKVHNSVTAHKRNFALEYRKKHGRMYVDRNDYYFETLFTQVDFTNKIFVSRGSSLMMYTRQNWGQEPFLIFTYKLYDDYLHYGDVNQIEDAVLFCKNIYSDPSKIMVPNSKFEFENMVEEAFLRSLGY